MNQEELSKLLDKCSKGKHHIKSIKDNTLKILVKVIISSRTTEQIIK